MAQLRTPPPEDAASLTNDEATYISSLYERNTDLRRQVAQLTGEISTSQGDSSTDKSRLETLVGDLESMRIASGQVEVTGPGVTVLVDGNPTVFELQDLVNEVRNASAEALAINGVRVVTRSAIVADEEGRILLDRQLISSPYRIEAIGDPATLLPALQRKGGLIALLEEDNPTLIIEVASHSVEDKASWLKLPRSTADFTWVHAKPEP